MDSSPLEFPRIGMRHRRGEVVAATSNERRCGRSRGVADRQNDIAWARLHFQQRGHESLNGSSHMGASLGGRSQLSRTASLLESFSSRSRSLSVVAFRDTWSQSPFGRGIGEARGVSRGLGQPSEEISPNTWCGYSISWPRHGRDRRTPSIKAIAIEGSLHPRPGAAQARVPVDRGILGRWGWAPAQVERTSQLIEGYPVVRQPPLVSLQGEGLECLVVRRSSASFPPSWPAIAFCRPPVPAGLLRPYNSRLGSIP